jgi:rare lipoprotein A
MMKRALLLVMMTTMICLSYSFNFRNMDEIKTSYASFYHANFNGRKTANGEFFDSAKLTAAHKTLPFNALVKVTNLKSNESVVVRINDRGPYVNSRSLDLSLAAFKSIGQKSQGIIPVKYEIIKK